MNKILTSLMAASLLLPSVTLASSIRPGSNFKPKAKAPKCLVEEKWEPCQVTIDETGVKASEGHITNVVQWSTDEKPFNVGGSIGGAVAGGAAGTVVGLGSCVLFGPLCIITAPAIMSGGVTGGATVGGQSQGRYFTIVGDDVQGTRLIQELYYSTGKSVKKASRQLLTTTKLAEGEVRS
tara:strand:+ start:556 stop:1095 length:540 start_codon:yes stop_codon:yes gene_type:complete